MTIKRMPPGKSTPPARDTSLEGEEAIRLYVAEMGRKIDALNEQIGLLQAAFTERKQLLCDLD